MSGRPILLRVLFFREPHDPETWVAQALEHDISAYGKDYQHARRAFKYTVVGHFKLAERNEQEPFATLAPAPDGFWDIWRRITTQQTIQAEPIPSFPGHMLPAVTDEPVSTTN